MVYANLQTNRVEYKYIISSPATIVFCMHRYVSQPVSRPAAEGGNVSTELLYSHTRIHNIYTLYSHRHTPTTHSSPSYYVLTPVHRTFAGWTDAIAVTES